MARLLLVWQSRSGRTTALKDALVSGIAQVEGLSWCVRPATETHAEHLLWADGCLFGCAEHFGQMAGLFKDFLERIYEPCGERLAGRPYGLFVAAGNDGRGAISGMQRVLTGLRMKPVMEPICWRASEGVMDLTAVREQGQGFALGLQSGLW